MEAAASGEAQEGHFTADGDRTREMLPAPRPRLQPTSARGAFTETTSADRTPRMPAFPVLQGVPGGSNPASAGFCGGGGQAPYFGTTQMLR